MAQLCCISLKTMTRYRKCNVNMVGVEGLLLSKGMHAA